jgi:hypothetical protein
MKTLLYVIYRMIKLRIRWTGLVACMTKTGISYDFSWENVNSSCYLGYLGVCERIILNWMLWRQDVKVWNEYT